MMSGNIFRLYTNLAINLDLLDFITISPHEQPIEENGKKYEAMKVFFNQSSNYWIFSKHKVEALTERLQEHRDAKGPCMQEVMPGVWINLARVVLLNNIESRLTAQFNASSWQSVITPRASQIYATCLEAMERRARAGMAPVLKLVTPQKPLQDPPKP